jgi:phage shock protein PspC (stress-responsive transcriptional regulator)
VSSTSTTGGPAKFFATIRSFDVERPGDRWFAGVCGGIAGRLGVDPLLVRAVLVALTAVGGLGLAFYGVCWLLLPDGREATHGRIEAEAVLRGDVSGSALLAGVLVVADVVLPRAIAGLFTGGWSGPGWGFLITGLLVPLGWWLLHDYPFPERRPRPVPPQPPLSLVKAPRPQPAPEPQAGFGSPTERRAAAREEAREKARVQGEIAREKARRAAEEAKAKRRPGSPLWTTAVLGTALLAAGAVVAVGFVVDLGGSGVALALCAALLVLGFGAFVAGLRGRSTALVGLAWPVAFFAVATGVLPPSSGWTWEFDRTWRPTGDQQLSSAVGLLTVDPSALGSGGDPAATVAAGRLDVQVPTDATVLLDVQVVAGSVRWAAADDLVEIPGAGGSSTDVTTGGLNLRRVFAIGPGAGALAEGVQVRGDDPQDWTVPAGTPELRAVAWAGEVRIGSEGSTLLEAP